MNSLALMRWFGITLSCPKSFDGLCLHHINCTHAHFLPQPVCLRPLGPVSFSGPFPFPPGIVCAALTSGRTHTLGRSHIGFQILGRWGFVKSNVLCQSSMYVEVRWFAHIYPLPRRCPFLLNRDAPKEQSEAISGRASSVLAVCFSTSRFRSSPCVTTDQTL